MGLLNWNKKLLDAINAENPTAMKRAIEKGANAHAKDAMIQTIQNGNVRCLDVLLDTGANFEVYSRSGQRAFAIACQKGHLEIVMRLLQKGADVSMHDDSSLCNASFNGHADVVRALLNAGAPTGTIGSLGETPLNAACNNGHAEVVAILLAAGARLDHRHPDGMTARQHAEKSGNPMCIAFIETAERGVRPNPEEMGIVNRLGDKKEPAAAKDATEEQVEPEHQKSREAEIRERFKINPENAKSRGL